MTDSQRWMALSIAVLMTWRLCHLVAHEDGPLDVVAKLREAVGNGAWGRLMDCSYCLSLWWAAAPATWLASAWSLDLLPALGLWLGISGGACTIEKLTCGAAGSPAR